MFVGRQKYCYYVVIAILLPPFLLLAYSGFTIS